MKNIKRAISVFLAVLMIMSSMSAFAVLNDGGNRTITSQVRFYRYDEAVGDYVETIRVAPGDEIEARIILQSDFIVGTNFLYYLYDKNVFEIDTENTSADLDSYDQTQRNGSFFYGDILSAINRDLVGDGYLDSSVFDDYGACYFYVDGGISNAFDGTTEVYKAHLKVKEDAEIGSVGSMFIPTETAQHNRDNDDTFLSQPTYAARLTDVEEAGIDVGKVGTETSEAWNPELDVTNLASSNINTIAAAQSVTPAQVTAGQQASYNNGATVNSSFVMVTENINVTYYVLNEDNTYITDENDDSVLVTWQTSDSYTSGKSAGKTYYFNFTSYQEQATTCLDGLTPVVPTVRGNLQNIPEGYYFAGWMPILWDDGIDVDREDALSYMTTPASISDTVAGTVYEWPTATAASEKNTSKTYTDSYAGLVADPNAATMKALTAENYGEYLYEVTDDDTGDVIGHNLDLIALILPIPTDDVDVTVADVAVPGAGTITGSTIQVTPGDSVEEADVLDALADDLPEVTGYTVKYYVNDAEIEFPYSINNAVTITPTYVANPHTITYMNGETLVEKFDVAYDDELEITAEEYTAPAGYEIDEDTPWLNAEDKTPDDYESMPDEDLVFYAQFKAVDQTITYYLDNVATGETSKEKTNETFTLNDLPTKAGYEVTGWTLKDAEGKEYTGTVMPAGGLNAYATSIAQPQAITYKVDGVVTALTPATADTDAAITLAEKPSKAGYTYSDWTLEDGTAIPDAMPAGGIVVVSTSTADDQTITYKVDGEEVALTPNSAKTDAAITLAAKPTKDGYTYSDWTLEDGSAIPATMPAGGIVVVSNGTAQPQTITYIVDGVVDTTITPATANTGAQFELPATPEKPGYTYTAWAMEDGSLIPETMPAGGIVLVSFSEANSQPITYKVDGVVDATLTPATADTDAAITLAEKPSKPGYTYSDWTLEDGSAIPEKMPVGGIVVVSTSTALDQTITYKVEGEADKEETYATDATVAPYTPSKIGYEFDGWYTDDTYATKATAPTTMPAQAVVLYGRFTPAGDQKITYKVAGEADVVKTATTGEAIPAYNPTADAGYKFDGWYTDDTYSTEFTETKMPAGGVTVYGRFVLDKFTVKYVDEDDTVIEQFNDVEFGSTVPVTEYVTSKTGATFTGWADENGKAPSDYDGMPAHDVTFYAQFADDVVFTFQTNGGAWYGGSTADKTVTVPYNATLEDAVRALSERPEKDSADGINYSFDKWVLVEGRTYKATYTEGLEDYSITYKNGDETVEEFKNLHAGDEIKVTTKEPEKTGATFVGWADADGKAPSAYGTMPANDLVFYAQFEDDLEYIFMLDGGHWADGSTEDKVVYVPYDGDDIDAIGQVEDPEKTGYDFNDWVITGENEFTADWDVHTKKITYMNGETIVEEFDVDFGDDIEVTTTEPTKAGYEFIEDSWVDADGKTPDDYGTMPDNDLVFYAQFKAVAQPITYKVDGEVVTLEPATADTDAAITLADKPEKDGYTYTAWAMEDGSAIPEKMPVGGIVVVSTSTAEAQPITYKVDGEEVALTPATADTDAAITLADKPTKDGYTYSDWALEDGTAIPEKMPYGGIVVVSTSTALDQTITYKVDGEVVALEPSTAKTDAAFTLAAKPENAGYTYSDWAMEDGSVIPATMPVGGITVVSTSTAEDQLITYIVDGVEVNLTPNTAKTGAAITLADKPEKDGYTYSDWTLEDGSAIPDEMPAGGIKVVSTSTVNQYKVTIKDAEGNTISEAERDYNTVIPFPSADDMKVEGKNFIGWTADDGTVILAEDAATALVPAKAVTFTATYGENTYKVTIKTEKLDGTFTETSDVRAAAEGDIVTATDADKTATGYYVSEDDSTLTATVAADNSTEIIVVLKLNTYKLYAVVDGGEATEVAEYKYGEAIDTIEAPTETGKEFHGWYADKDCNKKFTTTTMPASDVTVYGKFTNIGYQVHYDMLDGTFRDILTYYGDEIPVTDEKPTKTGYAFKGWNYTVKDEYNNETEYEGTTMPACDLYATPEFEVASFSITYYVDGNVVAKLSQDYDTAINYDVYTAEAGMKLDGWYNDADCTEKTDLTTMPADNVKVYAKTVVDEETTKTVTFTDEDGNEIGTQEVVVGTTLTPETAVPEKEGYKAGYWSIDGENPINDITMPNEDVTLVPVYNEKEAYTVSYVNGTTTVETFENVEFGDTVDVTSEEPTKEGYDFIGWLDADGKAPEDYETMPAKALTFEAQFEKASFTITYDTDGGSAVADATVEFEAAIPEATSTKEGYSLAGWTYTDAEGNAYTGTTMPASNLTAKAIWNAVDYTITYVTDGTTVVVDGKEITSEDVAFGNDIPTGRKSEKEGYDFEGWTYTDADGKAYTGTTMPASNLTATAVFNIKSYKVAYVVDGEEITAPEVEYKGDVAATEPKDDPSKPGYTFTGWVDAEGNEPSDYDSMPANEITFVAQFEEDIEFIFDPDGGKWSDDTTEAKTVTVPYDKDISDAVEKLADEPTKEGYDFEGWALTDEDTYAAQWTAHEWSITYMNGETEVEKFEKVAFGDDVDVTTEEPEKAGYELDQDTPWVDADGKTPEDYESMPDNDLVFYAQFKALPQTITYKVDGEVVELKPATADTDAAITLADKPTEDGYTYSDWTLENGDPVPEKMPAGGITVVSNKEADAQPITYKVDGKVVALEPSSAKTGAAITLADKPSEEGYTYTDWAMEDGTEIPATMPVGGIVVVSTSNKDSKTYTFDAGEGKFADGESTKDVVTDPDATLDDAITALGEEPTRDGYEFAGWTQDDTTGTVTANWKAIVKLVPANADSKAMIERDGVVETNNTVAEEDYPNGVTSVIAPFSDTYGDYSSTTYDKWYVTGLGYGIKEENLANYVTVTGGGSFELENTPGTGKVGTGTVIVVKDADGNVVEKFTIVIYGDLDGNGYVTNDDVILAENELTSRAWSGKTNSVSYLVKAADLDQNKRFTNDDLISLEKQTSKTGNINQVTGVVINK